MDVERLKNAFRRGHGRLDNGIFLGKFPQRLKKEPHIGEEGHQFADGQLATDDLTAAVPDDQGNGRRTHEFGQGHKGPEHPDLAKGAHQVFAGEFAVDSDAPRLSAKSLDNTDPGKRLGEEGVDLGHLRPDRPEGGAGKTREDQRRKQGQGHKDRHHQGQPYIHHHQKAEDPHQFEAIIAQGDHHRSEHFVHVLDVVGQPGDQTPGGLAVEIGKIQGQKVGKEVLPQAVHDRLPDPFEHHHLDKGGQKDNSDQQPIPQGDPAQSGNPLGVAQGPGNDIVIDPQLHQPRQTQSGCGDDQGENHRPGQPQQVARTVDENPPPEPGVADDPGLAIFQITEITHRSVVSPPWRDKTGWPAARGVAPGRLSGLHQAE